MNGDEAMYQHELVQQQFKEITNTISNLSYAVESLLNIIEKQQQQLNELSNAINQ